MHKLGCLLNLLKLVLIQYRRTIYRLNGNDSLFWHYFLANLIQLLFCEYEE